LIFLSENGAADYLYTFPRELFPPNFYNLPLCTYTGPNGTERWRDNRTE